MEGSETCERQGSYARRRRIYSVGLDSVSKLDILRLANELLDYLAMSQAYVCVCLRPVGYAARDVLSLG